MELRDKQFLNGAFSLFKSFISSEVGKISSKFDDLRVKGEVKILGITQIRGEVADKGLEKAVRELKDSIKDEVSIKNTVKISGEVSASDVVRAIGSLEDAISSSAYRGEDAREFKRLISDLQKAVSSIKLPAPVVNIPKQDAPVVNLPSQVNDFGPIINVLGEIKALLPNLKPVSERKREQKVDFSTLEEAILEVKKAVLEIKLPENKFELPEVLPVHIMATEVVQKTPQPVTNININGLRGPVKSTAVSVTTTALSLPATALNHRRSMIVYNNDSSAVLYIGGSDVTTSNGLPVFAQSYSPPIDLSDRVTLYGVSTTTIDVRVLEASMDDIGS